jgi:mannose-1-phosphate guanylyltransferase
MIEAVISRLGRQGVTDAVLSLGYKPDAFRESFPSGECAGVRLVYAQEPEPLGTAGAVRFAAEYAEIDETMIVVNGDVLTSLDVRDLWDRHVDSDGLASIALTPVDDPSRFGVVPTLRDGRVEAFIEKPAKGTAPTNNINAGTYVIEPEVIDMIPTGRAVSIERETFPALVEKSALFAWEFDEYWLDAGTRASYVQANMDVIEMSGGKSIVSPAAVLGEDVEIDHSVVGAGARIDRGARIIDSVILPRAVIGPNAWIEGSVIGSESNVGMGARVASLTVVGTRQQVGAGAVLEKSLVPPESEW